MQTHYLISSGIRLIWAACTKSFLPLICPLTRANFHYILGFSSWIITTSPTLITYRPESNILKNLPKILPGISQNFHYYASQCSYCACIMLLSCQQFLALSWKIQSNDCSITVFHYKVTVLLKSIDLRSYVQCI